MSFQRLTFCSNRITVQNVTHVALEATFKYMFKTTDFGAVRKPSSNGSQSHATDVKVIECYFIVHIQRICHICCYRAVALQLLENASILLINISVLLLCFFKLSDHVTSY